jgi:hypothetical protein
MPICKRSNSFSVRTSPFNGNLMTTTQTALLDRCAEDYVRLVLAVGLHDTDYVDAFYGPEHLKAAVDAECPPLPVVKDRATATLATLRGYQLRTEDELLHLRHQYLMRQIESLLSRVSMLSGTRLTFDEESQALYDAVAPTYPESHFREILKSLDSILPGSGPIPQRFDEYRQTFTISKDKLDAVFTIAITEARARTRKHISLPDQEKFQLEYVTGKSWSGYNWYKGNSHSLIQINTDFPISIDRAIDLASHEGYPGHHVYNALLEQQLVRARGWIEFTVYPLFSPQSLIAEGTANYGIEMAFPGEERVAFEQDLLFPSAGLDGSRAAEYYRIHELFLKLNFAGNEAARRYLNGEISREDAAQWLIDCALMSPDRARQRTRFFDQYRSYVINYNLGQDLVRAYLERRVGPGGSAARRWEEFGKLLSSPRLPSGLMSR